MLDILFKYDGNIEEAFNIQCVRDADWKQNKNRLMIVLGHIPSDDLKNKQLLSCPETRKPLIACIKQAQNILSLRGVQYPQFSYCCVNFFASKHYHLARPQRIEKENEFVERLNELIKKLKPTHVLLASPDVMEAVFTDTEHTRHKLGWVFEKENIKYVGTLDLYDIISIQRKSPSSNVLNCVGFLFQHFANLMQGINPYSISLKLQPVYIDSREKFDRMMRFLNSREWVGLDTETRNLSVLNNAIYTIQFSGNGSDKGFLLSLNHPQTPWSTEDLKYFKRSLRKFFASPNGPTLITFNGAFDLRLIRKCLKLPIIYKKVWEVMAGEHLLDENVNDLTNVLGIYRNKIKPTQGNLRATLCRYGNDFYFKNAFTKEDRETTGQIPPDDPDFLKYGCMDVVCLQYIKDMQIKRASHMKVGKQNYKDIFINHMLHQMSDTIHVLSHLKQDGSYVDMNYMSLLISKQSPIVDKLREVEQELNVQPEVIEANKKLCGTMGFKSNSLFGGTSSNRWVFSWTKPSHKSLLFFDVMNMKPVSQTAGGEPAVDKTFLTAYGDSNRVVSLFRDYQKLNKMFTSYIKGWYRLLTQDMDCKEDKRLRPDYAFYNVATGRIASRNPSLQVIPQHSDVSKFLKRAFVAPPGCILVHYDYSAQEVRTWGIVAKDEAIAGTFRQGQTLRKAYIKNPTEENRQAIKKKGDVHILNVKLFFNKDVDKSHPLRYAIKAVVFGTLYGMSAKTLGENTKQSDKGALREKIRNAFATMQTAKGKDYDKAEQELELAKQELDDLTAEDKTEYAQGIIDKMFSIFKKGKQWIDRMKNYAETQGYVFSPIGRLRHLPAVFVSDKGMVAKQVRRGSNAPIQGFASEIAVKANRISMETYFRELPKFKELLGISDSDLSLTPQSCRIVHDASYFAVPYCMVLPFLHIIQYMATYGVANAYEQEFGFKFNMEPEIEVEFTAKDDVGHTWDWSLSNLLACIDGTVDDLESLNLLIDSKGNKVSKQYVLDLIYKPYTNKKFIHYLQSKYPLLGVKDLEKDIYDIVSNRGRDKRKS